MLGAALWSVDAAGAVRVELPIPDHVREAYLEVRHVGTAEVVTVLEILSPTNKHPGEGRRQYEQKRLTIFGTPTNLVEIDLLRAGDPMTMWGNSHASHYRVLVSRARQRPSGDLYPFNVRQPIPDIPLPLLPDDAEPSVELNRILHDLYERAGYDLRINYRGDATPPLEGDDAVWADALLREAGLRNMMAKLNVPSLHDFTPLSRLHPAHITPPATSASRIRRKIATLHA